MWIHWQVGAWLSRDKVPLRLHMGEQANTIIIAVSVAVYHCEVLKRRSRLSPPLDITAAELEAALRILDKALDGTDSI